MFRSGFFFAIALIFASCFFTFCIRATAAIGAYALTGMFRRRFFFAFTLLCASCFFAS